MVTRRQKKRRRGRRQKRTGAITRASLPPANIVSCWRMHTRKQYWKKGRLFRVFECVCSRYRVFGEMPYDFLVLQPRTRISMTIQNRVKNKIILSTHGLLLFVCVNIRSLPTLLSMRGTSSSRVHKLGIIHSMIACSFNYTFCSGEL